MSPSTLILVGSAVPLTAFVFARFVRWEREGRRHLVLGVFLGVVIAEALLAGATGAVPVSLFRPAIAGQDLRLPDPVLVLALLARLWVAPVPRMVRWLWAVSAMFVLWLVYCTLIGVNNGSDFADALFDMKSYLYIIGTMTLVAGVPVHEIILRRRFARWVLAIAVVSVVLMVMQLTIGPVGLAVPGLPILLGELASETHSVLIALGILAFCVEACSRRPRVAVVAASILLLLAPFSGSQRASFVQLGVTVLCLVPFMVTATWIRRVKFNPTDALVFLFGFLIAGGLILGLSGELPAVSDQIRETFGGQVEAANTSVRVSILETSAARIQERPVFGWGMGDRVSQRFGGILGLGQTEQVTSHNVLADLALRAGLVGFVLGLLVVASAVRGGLRVWLTSVDDRVAGAALGAMVGLAGLLGKGMVETVFEKFRIGIAFGFLLGLLISAARSARRREEAVVATPGIGLRAVGHGEGARGG